MVRCGDPTGFSRSRRGSPVGMSDTPDPSTVEQDTARRNADREYSDLDPDQITEDALEYFDEPPGDADSPAADADAPTPG